MGYSKLDKAWSEMITSSDDVAKMLASYLQEKFPEFGSDDVVINFIKEKLNNTNISSTARKSITTLRKYLRITFPDGEVIYCEKSINAFKAAIIKIGVAEFEVMTREMKIICSFFPLVIKGKPTPAQHTQSTAWTHLEDDFWVNTRNDNAHKKSYLDKISAKYKLGLIVSIEEDIQFYT